MRRLLLFYIVSVFGIFESFSQEVHPYIIEQNKLIQQSIDSLDFYPNQDTLRVLALQKVYTKATFKSQAKNVLPYANEAGKLSKKLDYKFGLCFYYVWKGENSIREKNYKEAVQFLDSLHTIKPPYPKFYYSYCGFAERVKGDMYKNQENYYTALEHLFLAVNYFKKSAKLTHQHQDHLLLSYNSIAKVYYNIESLENASFYANLTIKAIDSEKIAFNTHGQEILMGFRSEAELMLADIYIKQQKYDDALTILRRYKNISDNDTYYFDAYTYNQKVGDILFIEKQYDSAHVYFKNAYKVAKEYQHSKMLSNSLYSLTQSALKLGNLDEAKTYAEDNTAIAQKADNLLISIEAAKGSSLYLNAIGNDKDAYVKLSGAMALKDSLMSETNLKQINTLNAIYQSDQDKEAISKLNIANEKKANLNKIFIGSSIALLLIGFLGYRNFRNKRKLQNLKISELEKDKQLLTVDAMLKGQEEERSRIAKDLHDGLGSLLSGTKLSFINMKENLILTPENVVQFDKSLRMLDTTIVDLRKVAQNLMPETLIKFGLHDALRDFCNAIESSSKVIVDYQKIGVDRKLPNTAEVFIYRIVQELVNNAIKHAKASEIIVQLAISETKASITVEDDGIGYDKNSIQNKKGSGLDNIEYRVHYLNGTIDTHTSLNNGTSVNIELNV